MPGLATYTTPGQRHNSFSDRRLSPAEIYPGAILWMPAALNESTEINPGKFNHPVVVLFVGGVRVRHNMNLLDQKQLVGEDEVLVVGVTTFNGTFLVEHFADNPNPEYRRRGYIPLECIPRMPHPDTGLILETNCLAKRPSMVYTQSYVALEPFTVPKHGLVRLKDGKIELKKASLKLLEREIEAREAFGIRDEINISVVMPHLLEIAGADGVAGANHQRVARGYGTPRLAQPARLPSGVAPIVPVYVARQQPPPPPPPPYTPQYYPPLRATHPIHAPFDSRPLLEGNRYTPSQNVRTYGSSALADRAPRTTVHTGYGIRGGPYEVEAQDPDSSPSDGWTFGGLLKFGMKLCVAGVFGHILGKWWMQNK